MSNIQEIIKVAEERDEAVKQLCVAIDLLDRQGIVEVLRHIVKSLGNKQNVEISYKTIGEMRKEKSDLPLPPPQKSIPSIWDRALSPNKRKSSGLKKKPESIF